MRLRSETIDKGLSGSNSLFLLFGEEVFLINESLLKIKNFHRELGFNEFIKFDITSNFNWNSIFNELNENSLFASHKVIILNI